MAIRQNFFDSLGNYLYCQPCLPSALDISAERLAIQREIKRQCSQNPIRKMKKSEVTKESLSNFVIMPDGIDIVFNKWWVSMDASALVRVRYPHERRGNAGRPYNLAKQDVQEDFLRFVDSNSQPDGRSADSSGTTFYFSLKFTTIPSPKPTVHHFEERFTCWKGEITG